MLRFSDVNRRLPFSTQALKMVVVADTPVGKSAYRVDLVIGQVISIY